MDERNTLHVEWLLRAGEDRIREPKGCSGAASPVRFAKVKTGLWLIGLSATSRFAFELTLPNGWKVRAADAASLAQLLSVVRS